MSERKESCVLCIRYASEKFWGGLLNSSSCQQCQCCVWCINPAPLVDAYPYKCEIIYQHFEAVMRYMLRLHIHHHSSFVCMDILDRHIISIFKSTVANMGGDVCGRNNDQPPKELGVEGMGEGVGAGDKLRHSWHVLSKTKLLLIFFLSNSGTPSQSHQAAPIHA